MKTAKMTPFFQFHYFGPFWSVKYLSFLPKLLIWTAHHTFPESARPQGTKNLYYVSFTAEQMPIFLDSSSWTILEVEENFIRTCLLFYYSFGDKK